MASTPPEGIVRCTREDHVLVIEVDREDKRNAFTPEMILQLCEAFDTVESDPDLRCALVCARGDHFSAGLDLLAMGPALAEGRDVIPPSSVNPWSTTARRRTKPFVLVVQGTCWTLTIELALAADVVVAADDARFAQIEVCRGLLPFGGATFRFAQKCGRGNAMRYLLTGDVFDAAEAQRIGLVQAVVPRQDLRSSGLSLAQRIAEQAPLAVQASLENGWLADAEGEMAAIQALAPKVRYLMSTEDAAEGLASFVERRKATFVGR
jgi:enoyl-CoA hydratase/carnithine racemase